MNNINESIAATSPSTNEASPAPTAAPALPIPTPLPVASSSSISSNQVTPLAQVANPEISNTADAIKLIVKNVKNFNIQEQASFAPIKQEELQNVQAGLDALSGIPLDEANLVETAGKVAEVTEAVFEEGIKEYSLRVYNSDKTVLLFTATVLNTNENEVYVVFDNSIIESEHVKVGGSKKLSHAARLTSDSTEVEHALVTTKDADQSKQNQVRGITREANIKRHLRNLKPENQAHVVFPHQIVHLKREVTGGVKMTTQKSFVSFQQGEPLRALENPQKQAKQLLLLFADIHEQGVTHNDVKDENIILTDEGNLCLIDWDSSIHKEDQDQTEGVNTLAYTPPENQSRHTFDESQVVLDLARLSDVISIINVKQDLLFRLGEQIPPDIDQINKLSNEIDRLTALILKNYSYIAKEALAVIHRICENDPQKQQAIADLFMLASYSELNNSFDRLIEINPAILIKICSFLDYYETLDEMTETSNNYKNERSDTSHPDYTSDMFNEITPLLFKNRRTQINQKAIEISAQITDQDIQNPTHEKRVKSDSYQVGILLKNLFAATDPIPDPYDKIITELLNQNPDERNSVQTVVDKYKDRL